LKSDTLSRLVQGVYYLFLGLWFGAMVMLAVGAPVTFRTVRVHQPVLGLVPYNEPSLARDGPNILAGAITGNHLRALSVVQAICAVVTLSCVVLQTTIFQSQVRAGYANALRSLLIALPACVLVFDEAVLSPNVWKQRAVMYDTTLNIDARDKARAQFNVLHKRSEKIVGSAALMLAAALMLSPLALSVGPSQLMSNKPDEQAE
jgi:hypothetical protein